MAWVITKRGGAKAVGLHDAPTNSWCYQAITCGASNVKGAWAQLAAATPFAGRIIDVHLLGAETGVWYYLDVGIGAAGLEQVAIRDLQMQSFSDFASEGRYFRVPYSFPAGVRLAMRGQCGFAGTKVVRAALMLHAGTPRDGHAGMQRTLMYGASAGTQGTQYDPGGVANTKGAWVQIAAATTYPIRKLSLSIVPPSAVVFCTWLVDLGIGAAGAEQVLVGDIPFHAADLGKAIVANPGDFAVNIPAGARLSIRGACDSTSSPGRLFHALLNGQG